MSNIGPNALNASSITTAAYYGKLTKLLEDQSFSHHRGRKRNNQHRVFQQYSHNKCSALTAEALPSTKESLAQATGAPLRVF